jgi:hypothetical protein
MKRFILLAICAVALLAAVPSHAECASVGSVYACENTGPDYVCSYSDLAVSGHYSCLEVDDLQFEYFWIVVDGAEHYTFVNAWPNGTSGHVEAGPACISGFATDYPDAGAGLC